jgi:hypothetical protein
MANLNIRNVPDDLYKRIRLAAAGGGERIPKGALEKLVIRGLRRLVDDPRPGAGLPKLKLCAGCVAKNMALVATPGPRVVPQSVYDVAPAFVDTSQPEPEPADIFSHLLDDAGAVAGFLGSQLPADELFHRQSESAVNTDPAPPRSQGVEVITQDPALDPQTSHFSTGNEAPEMPGVEVTPGLFVCGDDEAAPFIRGKDFPRFCLDPAWAGISVLSAAKDPWHRQMVGYKTKSAPEGPERLFARRGNHMALNLIDVRQLGPGGHAYAPAEVFRVAFEFISERMASGDHVLVHCNKGESRSPTIALLWMLQNDLLSPDAPLPMFEQLYRNFLPSEGMKAYIREQLTVFASKGKSCTTQTKF